MEKKALGRGLDALLPTGRSTADPERGDVQELRLEAVVPNRFQPRQQFSEVELGELTASLKQNGLLQPILVRRKGDGMYELIAGERRLRAAKLAGMQKIHALIRNVSDQESMVLALVENLQRDDLNPMETARAYQRMLNEFGLTQEAIAQKVACDRSSVANMLRLTSLPVEVQRMIETDQLSTGHAKVILGLTEEAQQRHAAERVIKEALNVRQTEGLIAKLQTRDGGRARNGAKTPLTTDAHVASLENKIRERLGTKVQLRYAQGKGSLDVSFYSDAELERILQILGIDAE